MENNHHYNKILKPFANKLRKEMTKSEACLWKYALKESMMKGYPFRRQRPVLNYIADFMCKELNLIIELDGITHQWEETIIKDEKKQSDLEKVGFTVLRFSDTEVLNNMSGVIQQIEYWIEDNNFPSLPPRKKPTK